jgi:PEP-CTERM motif
MLRQIVKASALLALTFGAATPSLAGRGTQVDAPITSGPCTLGSSTCANSVDLSLSGSTFVTAYIYEEGVVSINGLLPTTAVAGDPSTWGSGIWFTPGISPGTTYQVNAYVDVGFDDIPISWGLNFFTLGSPTVDEFDSALPPHMQVQLSSGTGTYLIPGDDTSGWDGVSVALAYLPGFDPPADAWIGFSWGNGATQLVQNADGLLVGSLPTDTDFVSTAGIAQPGGFFSSPTQFIPLYATVVPGNVPEPATWTMMLLGFLSIGMALRLRPRAGVSPV